MATTIITKFGSGAPTASDVVRGELAVDTENGRLYTETSGGAVIELGTNPAANVTFGDNVKAIFGAGSDLQIYHDPANGSYVSDQGVGSLNLLGSTYIRIKDATDSSTAAEFNPTGASAFYYNNSQKLATTSTGIDVTGNITVGTNDTIIAENNIRFKSSGDAFIDHNTVGQDINFRLSNASSLDKTAMTLTSAGNVGIGTSSPVTLKSSTTLQVSGNAKLGDDNGRGLLSLGDISSTGANVGIWRGAAGAYAGTGNYLNLGGYDGITFTTGAAEIASQTERMRIDSSGNVGIGTSSPASAFHVDNGAGTRLFVGLSNNIYYDAYDHIFRTPSAASTSMTIANSGNVGIGTSSPSAQLHLQDGSTEDVSGSTIRMDLSGINPYWEVQARNGGAAANRQLGFYTSATSGDVLTLTQAGNVGIGTSSPAYKLDISGTAGANSISLTRNTSATNNNDSFGNLYWTNSSGNNVASIAAARQSATDDAYLTFNTRTASGSNTERMRIDSSGNLLVGTTTQTAQLTVNNGGNNYPSWLQNSNSSIDYPNRVISSYATGGQTATMFSFLNASETVVGTIKSTVTTTSYNTSSDQRLKENIVDAPSASDDIDAIQVRSFDWKVDGSHQKYGMVAQELVTVAPEAVSAPEDPEEMMGVDYSKLVPMLIKEVQQLRARVAELESK